MLSSSNNHGILQGQIGRSLSNERSNAWGAPNNSIKGVQTLGDTLISPTGSGHNGGGKNRGA